MLIFPVPQRGGMVYLTIILPAELDLLGCAASTSAGRIRLPKNMIVIIDVAILPFPVYLTTFNAV